MSKTVQEKKPGTKRQSLESSKQHPSPEREPSPADQARRQHVQQQSNRVLFTRALARGTTVALVAAVLTGALRIWIWILVLEPLALGIVIGEAAAVPSAVRHRRPPTWTYLYVFLLGCSTYLLIHVAFWLVSDGFVPGRSLPEFLRSVPAVSTTGFFQSVELARQVALVTGGALKYRLWLVEGLLMGSAAALAYLGGSVRKLNL